MIIDKRNIEQVIITDKDGGLLAVISDEGIVEHDSVVVIMDKGAGDNGSN